MFVGSLNDTLNSCLCCIETDLMHPVSWQVLNHIKIFPSAEVPHFLDEAGMKDEEVRLGQTAVIKCRVAGNPLPKITWYKDSKPLATLTSPLPSDRHFLTGDDQLLVVVETQPSDAGEYECVAVNTLGETRGFSYLVVRGKRGEVHTGGMDKSTTTGIIIIAVVCCIVGTSLVWVIIIYHTRKKRADDDADKDGHPSMLTPGPYQSKYRTWLFHVMRIPFPTLDSLAVPCTVPLLLHVLVMLMQYRVLDVGYSAAYLLA